MKYLIIGRTCTGKTHLMKLLQERGLKLLKGYTTRPKRNEGDDGYYFLSQEESKKITDKFLPTEINGCEYFMRKSDIEASDVILIDPIGALELVREMPEICFQVAHVTTAKFRAKDHAIERMDGNPDAADIFDSRYDSENERFLEFERQLQDKKGEYYDEFVTVHEIPNDYQLETLERYADYLMDYRELMHKTTSISCQYAEAYKLSKGKDHMLCVLAGTKEKRVMPIEKYAEACILNAYNMHGLIVSWLLSDNMTLPE